MDDSPLPDPSIHPCPRFETFFIVTTRMFVLSFNVQLLHGDEFVIYVNKQQNRREEQDKKHCVRGGCGREQQ
jgi:hypothetical protein